MTLAHMLQIVWRWRWVVAAVMLVAVIAVGLKTLVAQPTYVAQVKLQITAPQDEDIVLFDSYRSSTVQDATMIARNNLAEILESAEVRQRTIEQLQLTGADTRYNVSMEKVRDADFVYVSIDATSPESAQAIAMTHTDTAIKYYGEIRAKPATTTRLFVTDQLQQVDAKVEAAAEALRSFQIANGIADLSRDIANTQNQISDLQSQRDQQVVDRPTSRNVERLDELLTERRTELDRLLTLQSEYNRLQAEVTQTQAEQRLLQDTLTEANIKENTVKTVSFIQVIEPAIAPEGPETSQRRIILALGLLGGLFAGVMLALVLDVLMGLHHRRPTSLDGVSPLPADTHQAS